ncbi:MAG: hypothetical protein AMJ78_08300 [Omnitrophica WOR_2 bacterium SM23_29]|nr:MAG: hypothetical protein AMJ78_08300 [Omnitrophica WOR_2 bacterium SM23_29]
MKKKGLCGFTLLELLIAVTIFSIVAVAIYSSFNVGIRAWRKAENSYKIRQEARHVLNTIGRELRCAINSTVMPFEGSSNYVSFCRAMKVSNPQGGYSEGIFKITYTFDAEDKVVYYVLQTYEETAKEESGTKSLLASGVSDFKLQYAYLDVDKIVWMDNWEKEELNIPLGVKVSLYYPSQNEGQVAEYSETIFIPTGILKEAT